MIITVATRLVYDCRPGTHLMAVVQVARSSDQQIISERLTVAPPMHLGEETDGDGIRWLRGAAAARLDLVYEAQIDNGARQLLPRAGRQWHRSELPLAVLPFLLPSRFCPSDLFVRFACREFGGITDGVGRVMAVADWIATHVDYVAGVSTAESDAAHTFTLRAGVCRDFAHLGITLSRALGIPARAVSCYAAELAPPDFHAVMEVFIEGAWWMVDLTRLAPVVGLVRICHGRDAADIAFLTTDEPCDLVEQVISARFA
ncbi:MAG: transglutaminase family protein [Phreatobacter sp.]|uniref:transglutaminase-like domain-containing protein n=1 Tax=Phreatobacter sp. TaxID=1966341 RepID=UPI002732A6BE|nr:transglutaminase family protein [Phreatobacter sp.]MDP2800522.1 transglutaminase family protein [Phreatobacter sp.]